MKSFISIIFLFLLIASCKKTTSTEQAKIDDDILKKYIADNSLSTIETGSGLYVVVNDEGTGSSCTASSTVTVNYKGYYTNAEVFDESDASGATFGLNQVIKGWTEGIPYFKEGGSGVLLIPSALGYGTESSGSVPKNSVLIFDVELLDVQ